jgi:hypothetical protein
MRVANRDGADATNQIEIAISLMIIEILHSALGYIERFFVVVEVEVGHVLLTIIPYLFVGSSIVCVGGMVKGR